ncbi:MAG: GNAT family N-acetyltransferase [Bacteroidota bacterium]
MKEEIIAETSRLLFRKFVPDDAAAFFQLNSDPEVIRHTGDPPFESVETARTFIEQYTAYHTWGFGRWAVIEKDTDTFIGFCGLSKNEQDDVDLGYRFFQSKWGKGYATESAKASLDLGFRTFALPYIVGRSAIANPPSIRVLEKIGMTYWKHDGCKGIAEAVYYRIDSNTYLDAEK